MSLCVLGILGFVYMVRTAQREAGRMRVMGRLSQLRLSLENFESFHGFPPHRELKGDSSEPALSWLASVLPYIERVDVYSELVLNRPWNSEENSKALRIGSSFWDWYCEDGYFILPLKDELSIWDSESGLPRGTLANNPDAIALIALPLNGIHPLQPFTLTADELKARLGKNVVAIHIRCSGEYGAVKLVGDSLWFERR